MALENWKIGVVGAGQMGSGIAETAAQHGFRVINTDSFPEALEHARRGVLKDMDRLTAKGKKTREEADRVIARISYGTDLELLSDCDAVIEAIPEKMDLKQDMFETLDAVVKPETLLASNTSAIAISAISAKMKDPSRCVGMHFFCPAPVMKLVEVVSGCSTSNETIKKAIALAQAMGKEAVCAPELPGFLVNRILVPMQNEAAFLVMEGANPEDVDRAMKLAANFPMGPLELTDFVGVDVMYRTMLTLYENFHDSKYRPCPLLANMVAAGRLGRKTGHGFYEYEK